MPLPFVLTNGETARKHLPATMPGGISVFDFDRDGRLDLYFPNGGDLPTGKKAANKLLRNLGGMQFSDVTNAAGVSGSDYDFAAAAGDYDNDGWPDLLVSGLHGIKLYRNLGVGLFEDRTARAGLSNRGRWSIGAAWLDIDNDNDLDLFVVNYVGWDAGAEPECKVNGKVDFCHPRHYNSQPNALFRNKGDGTFEDVTESSGIGAHKGKGMSAAVADFDGNKSLDVFVTNDRQFAFLFLNDGRGRFREAAFEWEVAVPRDGNPVSGMGVDAQDFNNDGRPDLVYTALRDETFPLYRNDGQRFAEVSAPSRISVLTRSMAGWGIAFADLDGDGFRDIVAARSDALSGQVEPARREPLVWFRNSGGRTFTVDPLHTEPAMYRGLVAADLDNDGCTDVVVTALGAPAKVLQNPRKGCLGAAPRVFYGSSAAGYGSSLLELRSR